MNYSIEDPELIIQRTKQIKYSNVNSFNTYGDIIRDTVSGNQKVLDFGSANHSSTTTNIGNVSAHQIICENNKQVLAVDIVEHSSLRFSNSKYVNQDFLALDAAEQLDAVGNVSLVFAGNVIEHLSSPGDLFQLAHNVLPVGGEFVLTTVNPLWIIGLFDRWKIGYQSNCVDHTLLLGPPEIIELAERYGFSLIMWAYVGIDDMTPKFEPGGRISGRLIGLLYRYLRKKNQPPAHNLVGFKLVK